MSDLVHGVCIMRTRIYDLITALIKYPASVSIPPIVNALKAVLSTQ